MEEQKNSYRTPEIIAKEIAETTRKLNSLIVESYPHLTILLKMNDKLYNLKDYILEKHVLEIDILKRINMV